MLGGLGEALTRLGLHEALDVRAALGRPFLVAYGPESLSDDDVRPAPPPPSRAPAPLQGQVVNPLLGSLSLPFAASAPPRAGRAQIGRGGVRQGPW